MRASATAQREPSRHASTDHALYGFLELVGGNRAFGFLQQRGRNYPFPFGVWFSSHRSGPSLFILHENTPTYNQTEPLGRFPEL